MSFLDHPAARTRKTFRPTHLGMEQLEAREVPSVSATLSPEGVLRVEGTDLRDRIIIRDRVVEDVHKLIVDTLDSEDRFAHIEFVLGDVNRLEAVGRGGNDFIEIPDLVLAGGVRIDGGSGADTVVAGGQTLFPDIDPAVDRFIRYTPDSASQYYERVRAELTASSGTSTGSW
jgi:hypothetical protein